MSVDVTRSPFWQAPEPAQSVSFVGSQSAGHVPSPETQSPGALNPTWSQTSVHAAALPVTTSTVAGLPSSQLETQLVPSHDSPGSMTPLPQPDTQVPPQS
jgi:hypothetical protein